MHTLGWRDFRERCVDAPQQTAPGGAAAGGMRIVAAGISLSCSFNLVVLGLLPLLLSPPLLVCLSVCVRVSVAESSKEDAGCHQQRRTQQLSAENDRAAAQKRLVLGFGRHGEW